MNVLDSRCSVLTSLVCGLPPEAHFSKLVNMLHLESNTFIYIYMYDVRCKEGTIVTCRSRSSSSSRYDNDNGY